MFCVARQEQADDGSGLSVWRERPAAVRRRSCERAAGGGQTGAGALGDPVSEHFCSETLHIGARHSEDKRACVRDISGEIT